MRAITCVTVAAVVIGTGLFCADVLAQGQSQGRGRGSGSSAPQTTASVSASVVFRDSDVTTFRNYFTSHKIVAQPLPPGIAKNVARGKPLPPGIAKRAVPPDLLALGPKVGKDVSLAIVGEAVVALKGGNVIDVLSGVFVK
jgi:hypothetical protein